MLMAAAVAAVQNHRVIDMQPQNDTKKTLPQHVTWQKRTKNALWRQSTK